MLYVISTPTRRASQIDLYRSPDDASAHARDGQPIVAVAVHFESRTHCVVPDRTDPERIDRVWIAPAEEQGDGSITIRDAIPISLFQPRRHPPSTGNQENGHDDHSPLVAEPGGSAAPDDATTAEARHRIEIRDSDGLHLRLAARFAAVAKQFQAEIRVCCDDTEIDGKSVLGLLTLAAGRGARLDLIAHGNDAEAALVALTSLIAGWSREVGQGSNGV